MLKLISICAHAEHAMGAEELGKWLHWLGNFHFIFLHFPIALITMAFFSEILFSRFSQPLFDHAARFMLFSGAILAIPTALLGLSLSYEAVYEVVELDFFQWHRGMGIFMSLFAFIVIFLREKYPKGFLYWLCFTLLFLGIIITAFFGGEMAFESFHLLPPF